MNKLVSRIKTPDGTILSSYNIHDYVTYIDKITGEWYMLDGGTSYVKTSVNNVKAEDVSIYDTDDIEKIRNAFVWNCQLIKDLSNRHVFNIIKDLDSACQVEKDILINVFKRELDYRNEHSIFIDDRFADKLLSHNLIGISGKKQVGKDTVCKIIQLFRYWSKFGKDDKHTPIDELIRLGLSSKEISRSDYLKKSFAENVKRIASIVTNIDCESFENESIKNSISNLSINEVKITNRELLQKIGTDLFRNNIDPDIWVKSLFYQYKNSCNWIITDVRFPNEIQAIKERGGIVIKIENNNLKSDFHESETALDNYKYFDYVIQNNSSIDNLISSILRII